MKHLILTLLFSSCSLLQSYRIDRTSGETEGVFSPGESFQTTVGDVDDEIIYLNKAELLSRIDDSMDEKRFEEKKFIQNELSFLKTRLSHMDQEIYERFEYRLDNDSERSYLLNLKDGRERIEYLKIKGVIADDEAQIFEEKERNMPVLSNNIEPQAQNAGDESILSTFFSFFD